MFPNSWLHVYTILIFFSYGWPLTCAFFLDKKNCALNNTDPNWNTSFFDKNETGFVDDPQNNATHNYRNESEIFFVHSNLFRAMICDVIWIHVPVFCFANL